MNKERRRENDKGVKEMRSKGVKMRRKNKWRERRKCDRDENME